jgi:hypothetical protein
VGVHLFVRMNAWMADFMQAHPDYKIHMEEEHHIHKKDAPSGTGIWLAQEIIDHRNDYNHWVSNVKSNQRRNSDNSHSSRRNHWKTCCSLYIKRTTKLSSHTMPLTEKALLQEQSLQLNFSSKARCFHHARPFKPTLRLWKSSGSLTFYSIAHSCWAFRCFPQGW